jgi:hypothetical protein
MPYIIDGHNLIASLPNIDLEDPDDEARLVVMLRAFCARSGKQATVYFDRRAPGMLDPPTLSGVRVHFVASDWTADEAIRAHLVRLGPQAPNWTVVSSDREIRRAAERAGARVLPSKAFGSLLLDETPPKKTWEKPQHGLSPEELAYWMSLFEEGKEDQT